MPETRWYRQKKAMDLHCVECNEIFTPNREFSLFHADCYIGIRELERKIDKLEDKDVKIHSYVSNEELGLGCCECNKPIEANQTFVILHYSCNLKHIEFMNTTRKLAETDVEIKKLMDEFDGREKAGISE